MLGSFLKNRRDLLEDRSGRVCLPAALQSEVKPHPFLADLSTPWS